MDQHSRKIMVGLQEIDSEARERVDLRSRVMIAKILTGVANGPVRGAEREYQQSMDCEGNEIPFDLFEPELGAVTGAQYKNDLNSRPIVPAVFAASVAGHLRVAMPSAKFGTTRWLAVRTELTESSVILESGLSRKYPFSLGAQLHVYDSLAWKGHGLTSFESTLRENVVQVLSNALDSVLIAGSGNRRVPPGLLRKIGVQEAPTKVDSWETYLAKCTNLLDGALANTFGDIRLLLGVETMRKMALTFPTERAGLAPRVAAAQHLESILGAIRSSMHMPRPDPTSAVQDSIAILTAHSGELAVCPHGGKILVREGDSGSVYTLNLVVKIGDVHVLQPRAYARVPMKLEYRDPYA